MARLKLYQYTILWHPTEQEETAGKKSMIMKLTSQILAKDKVEAKTLITEQLTPELKAQLSQLEIVIHHV